MNNLRLCLIVTVVVFTGMILTLDLAHHRQPEIIILDKDAKLPAELTVLPKTKIVAGDRAALWLTVYEDTVNHYGAYEAEAVADHAVISIYGK